jgi:hypothetical protein
MGQGPRNNVGYPEGHKGKTLTKKAVLAFEYHGDKNRYEADKSLMVTK